MSLQELGNVRVTSVSKSPEQLREAPAAIYVITHDEIVRSGATSLPEALRLAPNLLVSQLTSSSYVAAARGLGGAPQAQNFANKLLILIDGRSVYTPLFSGIYYDAQEVLLDDVDRIEIISGPGATLWGANAMNGVINIITRPAYLTDGTLVRAGAGNREQKISARYGGKTDGEAAYRFYGKAFKRSATEESAGISAQDGWYKGQGGFRFDWSRDKNAFTVQGDAYRGIQDTPDGNGGVIVGSNALARWQRRGEHSEFQLQTYFDHTQRAGDGGKFVLHTYDIEFQHSIALGSDHKFIWGAGKRLNSYGITNTPSLLFLPPDRDLGLSNIFAQDTLSLNKSLKLTLGAKLEDNAFSGWEFQPDMRLAWTAADSMLIWAAASRAVRSPTPFDHDVLEVAPGVMLTGNPRFEPEEVVTYEIGYRGELSSDFSLSISAFYNQYDDLKTVELVPGTVMLPLRWDNEIEGNSYGVTAWAKWQVADWWRLSPGFTALHKRLRYKPGSSAFVGLSQAGNDPSANALVTSSMDLAHGLTFDATMRYTGALPEPALEEYYELTARLGWRLSDEIDVSLTGFNLLNGRHRELPAPDGKQIARSAIAEVRWSF